ncbi:MAG: response regulator [Candidatus Heimdallarchaeota archaeon]|nr:response regulator [Candidatus Heimdallarchaeota archaeon]
MKRILVIEDNEENIYLIRFILKKKGHEVIEARDGLSGVEKAKSSQPDIILMDIQLPKMNGYDATKNIRQDPNLKDIPIIAITSFAMPGDKRKCLDAGCSYYIEKPINPEQFIEVVDRYLGMN